MALPFRYARAVASHWRALVLEVFSALALMSALLGHSVLLPLNDCLAILFIAFVSAQLLVFRDSERALKSLRGEPATSRQREADRREAEGRGREDNQLGLIPRRGPTLILRSGPTSAGQ
jgi:hypothetical protein